MNEEVGHVSYGRISRGWWDIIDEGSTHMDVPLSKEAGMAAMKEVSRQASHQHVGPCTPGYCLPKAAARHSSASEHVAGLMCWRCCDMWSTRTQPGSQSVLIRALHQRHGSLAMLAQACAVINSPSMGFFAGGCPS
jgi:hypothetical protein